MASDVPEIRPLWDGWWTRCESIAGFAAKEPVPGAWFGYPERWDAAMDGIAEVIDDLGGWPADVNILFSAARQAVRHAAYEHVKHNKFGGSFWLPPGRGEEPIAERITDRIAAWQIAWALPADQWLAVWAVAEVQKWDGTQADAAALVELPLAVFKSRLSRARKLCRQLWICPDETPPARKYSSIRPDGNATKAAVALKVRRRKARRAAA